MKGHVYKRCPCGVLKDAHGRRMNCNKRHGTWYLVHELPADGAGRRRQTTKGGFSTEREARSALNDALARIDQGSYVRPTRQTVTEYLDQWLEGKGGLRSSTRRSYREHIDLYLRPGIGYVRLTELREVQIERMYAAMTQLGRQHPAPSHELDRLLAARAAPPTQPLTAARIRRVHATLMSAFNAAVKRRLIGHNPAGHVELASGRRPRAVVWTEDRIIEWQRTGIRPAVAVWTPQQAGAFLDQAASHRLYPMFHLIAYRGLRRGEAVGLRWQDADLDAGQLRITQQVIQLGWATEVGGPKTDSGERAVTLDRGTAQALRVWRSTQTVEREAWGAAWHHTGLMFTREDGSQLHPDTLQFCPLFADLVTVFERLVREAELPPIRLHDYADVRACGTPPPASRSPQAYRSRSCPNSSATVHWRSPQTPTRAFSRRSRQPRRRPSPTSSPATRPTARPAPPVQPG